MQLITTVLAHYLGILMDLIDHGHSGWIITELGEHSMQ